MVRLKLKLLKSTRQGDFASLNEDLIHYNQTDYKCTTKLLWLTIQCTSQLQVTNTSKTQLVLALLRNMTQMVS